MIMESIKKEADPVIIKWYDDEEIYIQDPRHLDIKERPRSDSITTSNVHTVNIVTTTEYPVVIKASHCDTVLNEKNVSPIKLGRQKEKSLAQHSESINCKVTKGNRFLNCTRKTPTTRSDDFLWKN
jgi:hypothetical protein